MAATWRLILFQFFLVRIPAKPGIYVGFWGLRVYCQFSCETENEAAAAILG